MTKPVTGIQTFAGVSPPWNLSFLDADIAALQAALNDVGTYSNYLADSSGAANQLTVTTAGSITFALVAGVLLQVKVANSTTSATVNMTVNGGANTAVTGAGGAPLDPGALIANGVYLLQYDGTRWQALNPAPYPLTAAEIAAAVTPTNGGYPAGFVDRYGTNTTPGTTDMSSAIATAVSVALNGAGAVYFGPSIYAHTSTLVFKNGIVYQGVSNAVSILKYTGVSDGIQVNNPINSSTIGNYDIRDLWLQATSANAGKANLADVGSTFVFLRRVRFSGAMIGLILDQTELASITDCLFQDIVANANATGVWLVNGAEHTGGAAAGFTNRISFYGCQFNSAAASTLPVLVADDGGIAHKFDSCNFQGGSVQVRLNGCSDNLIQACELEGCGTAAIKTYTTKWGGAAGGVSTTVAIDSCFLASGALLAIDANVASAVWHLRITNNAFSTTGATIGTTGVVVECLAQNNDQNSSGDNRFLLNNYFSGVVGSSYAVAWTGGSPVVGNGSLSGAYSRKGKEVTIRINLGIGSTTTFGAGAWTFSTPVTSANEGFNYVGAVFARCAGAAPNAGVPIVAPNALTCQIFSTNGAAANWGSATPGAWANGDSVQIQVTYKAANWLG